VSSESCIVGNVGTQKQNVNTDYKSHFKHILKILLLIIISNNNILWILIDIFIDTFVAIVGIHFYYL